MFRNRPTAAPEPDLGPDAAIAADIRAAYDRGRLDERKARKRHPVLMTLTFAAAAVGVIVLVLALMEGSFAGSGARVDQGVIVATPAVQQAADEAGAAIKDAGRELRDKSAQ